MIVEHWDNLQEKLEVTTSGHTMLDGPTEIADLDKTDQNEALVMDFIETVLVKGQFEDGNLFWWR